MSFDGESEAGRARTGDLMIERVRGPSELRAMAKQAQMLLWWQSEQNYRFGDAADQNDGREAQVILRSLSPDEHSAVMKLLRLWACNA